MWFPPKGGDAQTLPLGWFESNDGGFQKLGGRLSRHSNHHLLAWSLQDLRGFDGEVMVLVASWHAILVDLGLMSRKFGWGSRRRARSVLNLLTLLGTSPCSQPHGLACRRAACS
eukprot:5809192-Prymnesium_polylepis.1